MNVVMCTVQQHNTSECVVVFVFYEQCSVSFNKVWLIRRVALSTKVSYCREKNNWVSLKKLPMNPLTQCLPLGTSRHSGESNNLYFLMLLLFLYIFQIWRHHFRCIWSEDLRFSSRLSSLCVEVSLSKTQYATLLLVVISCRTSEV